MATNSLASNHWPPIIGVWVDQNLDDGSVMKDHLRDLSPMIQQWHFFKDIQTFYDFLDNPKNQIFLVMSGQTGQEIVPARHDYANIHSMYIFCLNVTFHRNLISQYNKVKKVMNVAEDLYEIIADDLSLLLIKIGESYITSQDKPLARNHFEEALRLMKEKLQWNDEHGRIKKVNAYLESLNTLDESILCSGP